MLTLPLLSRLFYCWIVLLFLGSLGTQALAGQSSSLSLHVPQEWENLFAAQSSSKRTFVLPGAPLQKGSASGGEEWGMLALQGFSGLVTGFVGSFLIHTLTDTILVSNQADQELLSASGVLKSGLVFVTMPWAVSAVVSLIGNLSQTHEGSYWWALTGAFVGGALAFGANLALQQAGLDFLTTSVLQFFVDGALMMAGAMLFFSLFRKKKEGLIRLGSLLSLERGQVTIGLPLPVFGARLGGASVSLSLFRGTW